MTVLYSIKLLRMVLLEDGREPIALLLYVTKHEPNFQQHDGAKNSRLFRKHGFDGIGLSALMSGAGLTQGGFYKQFGSKEDLAAEACSRAMEFAADRWSAIIEKNPKRPDRRHWMQHHATR